MEKRIQREIIEIFVTKVGVTVWLLLSICKMLADAILRSEYF